jgi:hypothetical protein
LETSVSKHDLEVVFGEYGPLEHIKTFHGDWGCTIPQSVFEKLRDTVRENQQ